MLFAKFGLLQTIQAELASVDYNRQTGRPVDQQRVAILKRMIEVDYHEFRVGNKGGFARTWSGKSTRTLALESPRQPLRATQYSQLFVAWSEQLQAPFLRRFSLGRAAAATQTTGQRSAALLL